MIDFPASPTIGEQFTAAGVTWVWDGTKWLPSGLSPTVVPGINDNRIINGDMSIDQRNNGAAGTASGYTVDRWSYTVTQLNKGTWGQILNNVPTLNVMPFNYYLGFQSSSAFPPATTDTFLFSQLIEGGMISDFAFSQPSAQPVTLSFWAYSSLTGTFSGALCNSPSAATRSYPFVFVLPTANTWTKINITIPGDTTGIWVMSGYGMGMQLRFDLGSGATWRAPAGAWVNGNFVGANGAVNVVATLNATFYVTGVKLEIGNVATPFNRQSLAKTLADCQRYYQTGWLYMTGYQAAGQSMQTIVNLSGVMRAAPTAVILANGSGNISGLSLGVANNAVFNNCTATTTGTATVSCTFSASAEL
jgi:hypothetical protein